MDTLDFFSYLHNTSTCVLTLIPTLFLSDLTHITLYPQNATSFHSKIPVDPDAPISTPMLRLIDEERADKRTFRLDLTRCLVNFQPFFFFSFYYWTCEPVWATYDFPEAANWPAKIGEYAIANVGDAIDEVVLADVLTVDTGADSFELMAYMVYGINDVTPVQSPAYIEIDGVQVEYQYTATYHYLYEEGGDIKTQECDAYVAVDSEGVISAVYYALAEGGYGECGTRLNDVSTRIDGLMNDLTIGELIEIDEDNTILNAISGATISTLDETINALSIQELFAKDIYGVETPYEVIESGTAGAGEIAFDSSYLYYYYNSENELVFVNSESESGSGSLGHLEEFTDEYGTLYTYGPTVGAWSLLLYGDYDETESGSDIGEKVYTINNVAQMQANVIENIGSCSLFDFYEMGVIGNGSEADDTWNTLSKNIGTGTEPQYIGDFTIEEFIAYVGNLPSLT